MPNFITAAETGPIEAVRDMVEDTAHCLAEAPEAAVQAASHHTHSSEYATHRFAHELLMGIDKMLSWFGLGDSETAEEVVYVLLVALLALFMGWIVRVVLLGVTRYVARKRNSQAARDLINERVFYHCSHVIPPLVFMGLIPFAFNFGSHLLWTMMRVAGVYVLIAFAFGFNSVVVYFFKRYNDRHNAKNIPLTGILNVIRGVVWIITIILCVAVLIDKSPAGILAGLGAFAAALMLIFKDSILGFTAGIQMAENDMIHVGDWIVVPGTPANGIVLDMTLSTVKIQNFDNTIVTVPPYSLVSGAFRNWRGMKDSGVRNINQSFTIDYAGIAPLSPEQLDKSLKLHPELQPYVDKIRQGAPSDIEWMVQGDERLVNGTLETNVGLLRLYLCVYLLNNPHISDTHRVLVQVVDTTIYGIQMSVWCWANTTDWNAYESIQSAVMEHITAVVADFGLQIYTAGSETIDLAQPSVPAVPSSSSK